MPLAIAEVVISPEMQAAGLEAFKSAKLDCMEEADIVLEIYLAMYGAFIKYQYEQETLH
jgi:hypothetical protein